MAGADCRGESPNRHEICLNSHIKTAREDCDLIDEKPEKVSHLLSNTGTDPWKANVVVTAGAGDGVEFPGEDDPLRKELELQAPTGTKRFVWIIEGRDEKGTEHPILYRSANRTADGENAGVRVLTILKLGESQEDLGEFRLPFRVLEAG